MRAPMVFAFLSKRTSRSACVSPLVATRTPLASRIQVSVETNVPTWGEYPALGPRILRSGASACAVRESRSEPQNPALSVAAVRRRKLLRFGRYEVASFIESPFLGLRSIHDRQAEGRKLLVNHFVFTDRDDGHFVWRQIALGGLLYLCSGS